MYTQEHWVDSGVTLRPMHVSSVEGMEDMIELGELHEKGILRNLFTRYLNNDIYVSFYERAPIPGQTYCVCLSIAHPSLEYLALSVN